MASNKNNTTFEQTSFLQGGNSSFIKEMYLKYLSNPNSIPQSWSEFFSGLDENKDIVKNEILGPSWAPKKKNNLKTVLINKNIEEEKNLNTNGTSALTEADEKEKIQSVKAIALIRAYRIRGHLIA